MVIIMERFTAYQYTPRHDVTTMIFGFMITISPPMPDTVDYAGRKEWDPNHLDAPHYESPWAKKNKVYDQH